MMKSKPTSPPPGTVWEHTRSGGRYMVMQLVFNTISDDWDVLYKCMETGQHFTRAVFDHEKAWFSEYNGKKRFKFIR